MQYARYGKPTGTSMASIVAKMKGPRKPFTPQRKIGMRQLSLPARQELKFLDTAISTVIDTTTEVITSSCNLVTQGDTASNRDGNIIVIKSIEIQGRVANVPGAAATSAPIVYIWLVLDRQPEGSDLIVAGASNAFLTGANNPASAMTNPPAQWMYKTIKKFVIPLTSQAGVTTAYNNASADIHYYKQFKNGLEIRFGGNAGTIADVLTNNLVLVAGCQDADDTPTLTATCRIRFTG